MAKINIKPNPRVHQIFEDLEKFRNFCVDFGYYFDERDLYSNRSNAYRQHSKHLAGKGAKSMWDADINK